LNTVTGKTLYVNLAVRNGSGTGTWVISGPKTYWDPNVQYSWKTLHFSQANPFAYKVLMGIHRVGTGLFVNAAQVDNGGTYTGDLTVPTNDPYSYRVAVINWQGKSATGEMADVYTDGKGNMMWDYGSSQWFDDYGSSQTQANGTASSATDSNPTPQLQQPAGQATPGPGPTPTPTQSTTGANSGSAVTQGSAAGNTNAITNALAALPAAMKAAGIGGSSGGATDMGPTNTILEVIKTNTSAAKKAADLAGYTADGYDGNAKATATANQAIANANEAAGAQGAGWGLGGTKGLPDRPSSPTVPAAMEGTLPELTFQFPDQVSGWGATATPRDDLLSWVESLRTTVRAVILWAFVLVFIYLASESCIEQGNQLANLQPWNGTMMAPENIVPLAGMAKHKLIATAAVVGIVAAWGLIIGYFNTELSANSVSVTSMFNLQAKVGSFGADVQRGLTLAGAWFPVRGVLQLGLSYIAIRWLGFGTVMATAIYMKFLAGCVVLGLILASPSRVEAAEIRFLNTAAEAVPYALGVAPDAMVEPGYISPGGERVVTVGAGHWWLSVGASGTIEQAVGFDDLVWVNNSSVQRIPAGLRRYGEHGLWWAFWTGYGLVITCAVIVFIFMVSRKGMKVSP
jgi:hypothetical protein